MAGDGWQWVVVPAAGWQKVQAAGWQKVQCRHPHRRGGQFSTDFWGLRPGHKPDISLAEYKSVIKLFVAAAVGCQGTKN
jgi:hypothetical protein